MMDIPDFLDIKLIYICIIAGCALLLLIAFLMMKLKKSGYLSILKFSSVITFIGCLSVPILFVSYLIISTGTMSSAIENHYQVKVMDLSLKTQKTTIIKDEKYLDCTFWTFKEKEIGVSCNYDGDTHMLEDIKTT